MADVLDHNASLEFSDNSQLVAAEVEVANERPLLNQVPRNMDPTRFSIPYGRNGVPKLVIFVHLNQRLRIYQSLCKSVKSH